MGEKDLLSPDKALEIILASTPQLGTEKAALRDVLGRVLAEDCVAEEDLPPFDNSAMDGYALIAEDTKGASKDAPRTLAVFAEEPAGKVVSQTVSPGTAVRIMTGAAVPPGANAVVMVEDTAPANNGSSVHVLRETSPGANIRRAGEDVRAGALVLQSGMRIGPSEMGMLASLGRPEIAVYKRPKAAIITTGDEIVDVSERPGPGQIRDSNQYSILGQTLSCGAEVSSLTRVTDERVELARVLKSAVDISDVIITSGGVSVGDYDLVKETLASLGDIRFWKVAIKPGKPLAYGHIDGKPLFGLPGNPVSSMVTFDLFVRPALLRMAGAASISHTTVLGVVSGNLKHKEGRREFVRAVTVWEKDGYVSTPTGEQGSGRLSSMLGANSYVVIPENRGNVLSGESVDIMLFQ